MSEEKVKIKITKKQVAVFAAIFGIMAAGFALYVSYDKYFKPIFVATVDGQPITFRADLREAQGVKVVPDQESLENFLIERVINTQRFEGPEESLIKISPQTRNITIAFKPVSRQTMGWYTVEATEIVNKLKPVYKSLYNLDVEISAEPVDGYENLSASGNRIIIALVHPEIANETSVRVDSSRNLIMISGARSLRNFDLATVKFMTVALGIKV